MQLEDRIKTLTTSGIKKGVTASCAELSEAELSRFLRRGDIALSAAKLARLQHAVKALETFLTHVRPALDEITFPLHVDLSDCRGMKTFCDINYPEILAAIEFRKNLALETYAKDTEPVEKEICQAK